MPRIPLLVRQAFSFVVSIIVVFSLNRLLHLQQGSYLLFFFFGGIVYSLFLWWLDPDGRVSRSGNGTLPRFTREFLGFWVFVAGVVIALVFFNATHQKPSVPDVLWIYEFFTAMGWIILTALLFLKIYAHHMVVYRDVSVSLVKLLYCVMSYETLIWVTGRYGDELYALASKNWNQSALLLLGVVAILQVLSPLQKWLARESEMSYLGVQAQMGPSAQKAMELTQSDRLFVAYHEAGHAMVHAALGCIHPEFCIQGASKELPETYRTGVLGYVVGPRQNNRLEDSRYMSWYMVMLLAGSQSELYFLDSCSSGSGQDIGRWQTTAINYLSNNTERLFYIDADSNIKAEHNAAMLTELIRHHRALLDAFFDFNQQLFHDMACELMAKEKITAKRSIDYFKKVQFPDGFPMPLGQFEAFSDEPANPEFGAKNTPQVNV